MKSDVQDQMQRVAIHVGHHIRLARQTRRMTQGELGERISLTFQQVQKYENGKSRISVPTLLLVAQALGVPISFFFEGLQLGPAQSTATRAARSAEGWEIAAMFTSIRRRGLRRQLMSIAREISAIDAEQRDHDKPETGVTD